MNTLKIKEQYKGLVIIKTLPKIGRITINTDKLDPANYEKYKDMGFDIFDEVKKPRKSRKKINKNDNPKDYE